MAIYKKNNITVIDFSNIASKAEIIAGSVNAPTDRVYIKIYAKRISNEDYHQLDTLKRQTSNINISKWVPEQFQIITSNATVLVNGNLSQAEYRSDVSPGLSEYFFGISGNSVQMLGGKNAIRKYLIDSALEENN